MLPDLIEVSPPGRQKESKVVLPGSKSLTNRALILAALASKPVTLRGALWSEDTQAMVKCLHWLGFPVEVTDDPAEPANRTLKIQGAGGEIPNAGTPDEPIELFVENAGTAARFLPPMLCLGHGSYRVSGIERMHQRPQAALVAALRQLGYRIDTANDRLPAVVCGTGPRPGAACSVSVEESSQFASALLLSAGIGGWQVSVTGANEDELPYVDMTRRLVKDFPRNGGTYDIEADASGASYFWGADWLLREGGSRVTVVPTPSSGMQADQKFLDLIAQGTWRPSYSRQTDLADSIMTAIVLAPFASATTLHRSRPAARAGMRAGEGAAHGIDQVRRARRGKRRHAHRPSRPPAWCCDRDLQRSSRRHVLRDAGLACPGHAAQQAVLRAQDVPQFLRQAR